MLVHVEARTSRNIRKPKEKMKTLFAISVISCLLVVGYTIDLSCIPQTDLTSCISRLSNARSDTSFCIDCATSLVEYYQDCTNRDDIDTLLEGENYQATCMSTLNNIIVYCHGAGVFESAQI